MERLKQIQKKLPPLFRKPYFYILLIFFVYMLFFDSNNMIAQYRILKTLKELKAEKKFYERETEQYLRENEKLMNMPEALEKYARSHYLMKRDNEDIYLFLDKDDL